MQGFTTPFGTINPFAGFPTSGQQWLPYTTQNWQQPYGATPFGGIPSPVISGVYGQPYGWTGGFPTVSTSPYAINGFNGFGPFNGYNGFNTVPSYLTNPNFISRAWPTSNWTTPTSSPLNGLTNPSTPWNGQFIPGFVNSTIPNWFNGINPISSWTNPFTNIYGGAPQFNGMFSPIAHNPFGASSPIWSSAFFPYNGLNGFGTPTAWSNHTNPTFSNFATPFGGAPFFGQQFFGGQIPTSPFNFSPVTNWANTINPFGGYIPTTGFNTSVSPFAFGNPFGFQPSIYGANPFFPGAPIFNGQPMPHSYPFPTDRDGVTVTTTMSPNGTPAMQGHMSHREAA